MSNRGTCRRCSAVRDRDRDGYCSPCVVELCTLVLEHLRQFATAPPAPCGWCDDGADCPHGDPCEDCPGCEDCAGSSWGSFGAEQWG